MRLLAANRRPAGTFAITISVENRITIGRSRLRFAVSAAIKFNARNVRRAFLTGSFAGLHSFNRRAKPRQRAQNQGRREADNQIARLHGLQLRQERGSNHENYY
jgi:hypothetical protein